MEARTEQGRFLNCEGFVIKVADLDPDTWQFDDHYGLSYILIGRYDPTTLNKTGFRAEEQYRVWQPRNTRYQFRGHVQRSRLGFPMSKSGWDAGWSGWPPNGWKWFDVYPGDQTEWWRYGPICQVRGRPGAWHIVNQDALGLHRMREDLGFFNIREEAVDAFLHARG
jgi:hypothetical protein